MNIPPDDDISEEFIDPPIMDIGPPSATVHVFSQNIVTQPPLQTFCVGNKTSTPWGKKRCQTNQLCIDEELRNKMHFAIDISMHPAATTTFNLAMHVYRIAQTFRSRKHWRIWWLGANSPLKVLSANCKILYYLSFLS